MTRIPLSKPKILLATLGSMLFVVAGIWMLIAGEFWMDLETLFRKLLGLVSIVFFGLMGVYSLMKLFDSKPGLVIGPSGITDNSRALHELIIRWEDIQEVETYKVNRNRFVLIFVRNPYYYIDQAMGIRKYGMRMNQKFYGTPLSISSTLLKYRFDDLETSIKKGLRQYGTSRNRD